MKTRAEIKSQAISGFTRKYWPVVGIGLLGMLLVGVMGYIPYAGMLLSLFIGTIIIVGLNGFYLSVYRGMELKVEDLFTPFNRYGRVLGGYLWKRLWLLIWALIFIVPVIVFAVIGFANVFMQAGSAALNDTAFRMGSFGGTMMPWPYFGGYMPGAYNLAFWNSFAHFFNPLWLLLLLLLIPVIIKSYSYFCTTYILADSPNVPAMEALSLSKKMMEGYKWKLFVTQLTFLGWFILCALTVGILWIFYVGPYFNAVMAGFYSELKVHAKQKGIEGAQIL